MREDMKEWQQGWPLAELKRMAKPFKHSHKPYCHGAFGLPKERDVAEALSNNQFTYCMKKRQEGQPGYGEVAACAIFSQLKTAGHHTDFAGREITIPAGVLFVRHLGWDEGEQERAGDILKHFLGNAPTVWLEIHEENAEAAGLARMHGFDWKATKVSAGSDIRGLYMAGKGIFLDQQPLDPAELVSIGRLKDFLSPDSIAAIKAELAAYEKDIAVIDPKDKEAWGQHYSSYNKRQSWTSFALRGFTQRPER